MEAILLGISSGIAWAVSGYLKSLKKKGKFEKFNLWKFSETVAIGGLVGILNTIYGWTYITAEQFLVNTGIVALVENAKKFIVRKFINPKFEK